MVRSPRSTTTVSCLSRSRPKSYLHDYSLWRLLQVSVILTFFEKEGRPFCQINFIDKATPYLSLYKGSGSLQFNWTTRVFYKYLPHMKVGCSGVDIETPHKLLLTLQQDNTPNENGNFLHLNL